MDLFDLFKEAKDSAVQSIIDLREYDEQIRDTMEGIIDSCETIEGEL